MEDDSAPVTDILHLPDPCLLAVLQCCAADRDPRSLFSAARAHSRLHQAAVLALSSVKAVVKQQQQADSLVQYLGKHGQHVHGMHIERNKEDKRAGQDAPITLGQLPLSKLQGLTSLSLCQLSVSLHRVVAPASGGDQGVGPAAARLPLRQLALDSCELIDGEWGLVAALAQLPGLEQLSLREVSHGVWRLSLPGSQLCWPERLLRLEVKGCSFADLQSLQPLTRLQDLRLRLVERPTIKAAWFSGLQCLTRLEAPYSKLEAGALAGKVQLQHLDLQHVCIPGGPAGIAELLSHLAGMQQLTYVDLHQGLAVQAAGSVSAYAGLTASSTLQHLGLAFCVLPEGAWQHLLPAGRQLPHLTELTIGMGVILRDEEDDEEDSEVVATPEGSRLVSCCPGLQALHTSGLWVDEQLLAPLAELRNLQELSIGLPPGTDASGLTAVSRLTQLRHLSIWHDSAAGEGLLLQLTQLRQLTRLSYDGPLQGSEVMVMFDCKAPDDEPVWRQLLRLHPRQPSLPSRTRPHAVWHKRLQQ